MPTRPTSKRPGYPFPTLIPQFILYARLHLTNTYWPWILEAFAGSSFFIFLFRQFFLGFPRELEDAAVIYILPMVIVFFFAQKHILKGVVTSGLKG